MAAAGLGRGDAYSTVMLVVATPGESGSGVPSRQGHASMLAMRYGAAAGVTTKTRTKLPPGRALCETSQPGVAQECEGMRWLGAPYADSEQGVRLLLMARPVGRRSASIPTLTGTGAEVGWQAHGMRKIREIYEPTRRKLQILLVPSPDGKSTSRRASSPLVALNGSL
ncbi:hypothetical protein O988_07933 [Pseudogymnoascus sp. VKM F-3808]|nr:hypothetical protein O988_07933 [Pseudogymnoascus sp. VKM F-3808]